MAEKPKSVEHPVPADPFGPHPTPSYGIPASLHDMKVIRAEVARATAKAKKGSWAAGWLAGLGSVVATITLAFVVWFKAEAMAQEKVDTGITVVNAQTDAKLAKMGSAVETTQYKVEEQNKKLDLVVQQQAEVLRLLKKKDK